MRQASRISSTISFAAVFHPLSRLLRKRLYVCATGLMLWNRITHASNVEVWQEADCVWNVMAHAQKPDFVFRRKGRVHLNRHGRQFSRLLAAEVCAPALVMLDTPRSEVVWEYWLPTPFTSFPFTSPPVRHRMPSGFKRTLHRSLALGQMHCTNCTEHEVRNIFRSLFCLVWYRKKVICSITVVWRRNTSHTGKYATADCLIDKTNLRTVQLHSWK